MPFPSLENGDEVKHFLVVLVEITCNITTKVYSKIDHKNKHQTGLCVRNNTSYFVIRPGVWTTLYTS